MLEWSRVFPSVGHQSDIKSVGHQRKSRRAATAGEPKEPPRRGQRTAWLELFQGRDDAFGEEVELAGLADADQGAVCDGKATFGCLMQTLDRPLHVLAVLAQVEARLRGLLDLVVVAALVRAMLAEHAELARRLLDVAGEDVARVGVPGHQPQRLLLARAADQDRRTRAAQHLRRVERAGQVVVLAIERTLIAVPHLLADEDGLLQALEAFGQRREEQTEPA